MAHVLPKFRPAHLVPINLGTDADWQRRWDEELRRRRLAAISAIDAEDAKAIELETPATKV